MPTCPRCGTPCEGKDRYCGKCGQSLLSALAKGKVTLQAFSVAEVRYKLGLIYYKRGELLDAIDIWQKILAGDPENVVVKSLIEKAQQEKRSERNLP